MDTPNYPKLPRNPKDGDQVADNLGNVFQYSSASNCWMRLGILESPPVVTPQNPGIVPPEIFERLKQLEDQVNQGIVFDKTKIYVGDRPDNPYFYYLHSTDDLVKFIPETLITGENQLRVEFDRGRFIQRLTRVPCIGPRGFPGPKGDSGKDGKPAANEQTHLPKSLTLSSFEVEAKVPTPIDEPISVRIIRGATIVLEVLVSVGGTDALEFNNISSEYVIDTEKTSLTYNAENSIVSGTIFLSKGTFAESTDPNFWRYKARQRGPQGDPGKDGTGLLEVVQLIEQDQLLFTDQIFLSLRKSPNNDNLSFMQAALPEQICVNRLKMVTSSLPVPPVLDRYVLAVDQAIKDCKDIAHYKFQPEDFETPRLMLPAWTPIMRCADRKRFEISKFRWFDDLDLSDSPQPGCFQAEVPFQILVGDKPSEQCCKEDFFLCNNLGDICQISGQPEVNVPPQPPPPASEGTDFPSSSSSISRSSRSSTSSTSSAPGSTGGSGSEGEGSEPPPPPGESSSSQSSESSPSSSSSSSESSSSSSSSTSPSSSSSSSSPGAQVDCCPAEATKVSDVLALVLSHMDLSECDTSVQILANKQICFSEDADGLSLQVLQPLTNNTGQDITLVGVLSATTGKEGCTPISGSKQSESAATMSAGETSTVVLKWTLTGPFDQCCYYDLNVELQVQCGKQIPTGSNKINNIPSSISSVSEPSSSQSSQCCSPAADEVKNEVVVDFPDINNFIASTNGCNYLIGGGGTLLCEKEGTAAIVIQYRQKITNNSAKTLTFSANAIITSSEGCNLNGSYAMTPPVSIGPGETKQLDMSYSLADVDPCCQFKLDIQQCWEIGSSSSSSSPCCEGVDTYMDGDTVTASCSAITDADLPGTECGNNTVVKDLDFGVPKCIPAASGGSFGLNLQITIPNAMAGDQCSILVTPTITTGSECFTIASSGGTQFCSTSGCNCVITVPVVLDLTKSCCTPSVSDLQISLAIESCCDPSATKDAALGCDAGRTPIYESSRTCDQAADLVNFSHENCYGTPCGGPTVGFQDRIVITYDACSGVPNTCFCILFDFSLTQTEMSGVGFALGGCSEFGSGSFSSGTVDFTLVFCRNVTETLDLSLIWKAATMCGSCACSGHPTISGTVSIECLSCCCCPSDENPGDNPLGGDSLSWFTSGGTTFINIDTCANGCGGSTVDQFAVCFLGCGFQAKTYAVNITNLTACPVSFRMQIGENFENFVTDTIAPSANLSFDISRFFFVSCPNVCDCTDAESQQQMCDQTTTTMMLNWSCDPQCCMAPALGGGVLSPGLTDDVSSGTSFVITLPKTDAFGDILYEGIMLSLVTSFSGPPVGGLAVFYVPLGGVTENSDGDVDVTFEFSHYQDCSLSCGTGREFQTIDVLDDPTCSHTFTTRYMQCYSCGPDNVGQYTEEGGFVPIASGLTPAQTGLPGDVCYQGVIWCGGSFGTLCGP